MIVRTVLGVTLPLTETLDETLAERDAEPDTAAEDDERGLDEIVSAPTVTDTVDEGRSDRETLVVIDADRDASGDGVDELEIDAVRLSGTLLVGVVRKLCVEAPVPLAHVEADAERDGDAVSDGERDDVGETEVL